MATTIKIKNKDSDTGPGSLRKGELAYAIGSSPTNLNGGDKLFIGAGAENGSGLTSNLHVIGGKYFTDMLSHTKGTLTASSAILVDSNKRVDNVQVGGSSAWLDLKPLGSAGAEIPTFTVSSDTQPSLGLFFTPKKDGTLRIVQQGTATDSYENLVLDPNDIPNKQYVDNAVQAIVTNATTLQINGFDDSGELPGPVLGQQGAVSLGTEKLNVVAGTGLNLTINDPQFGNPLVAADVTLTFDADVATANTTSGSSTLGVSSFNSSYFTVTSGWVESKKFTLGTTDVNLGNTGVTAIASIVGLTSLNAGNLTLSTDTLSNTTALTNGNIVISPKGSGVVKIGNFDIDPVNNAIAATNSNGNVNITPNGTGVVSVANSLTTESRITNVADPVADTDAANRRYVDSVAQGLTIRPAARAATTTSLNATYAAGPDPLRPGVGATLTANTLSALPLIDGVGDTTGNPSAVPAQTDRPWAVGDLILVRSQTSLQHNGLYEVTDVGLNGVTPWVLTRHKYVDDKYEIPSSYVFVQEGATLAGTGWSALVEDFNSFDVGVDDIYWYQFSGAGSVNAGNGISVTGTTVSVRLDPDVADYSGLEFNGSGELSIGTVPVKNGGTGRNAVPKNALVFGNDSSPGDGIGAMGATKSPGSLDPTTGDWDDSNQVPTFDGSIIRWTNTINGGTW